MNIHIWNPFKDHSLVLVKRLLKLMKPRAVPCRATQDGWVIVESSDKMWSTGGGKGKSLQYSSHENHMNCIKRMAYKQQKLIFLGSGGWDTWVASLIQKTRTWANTRRWWGTGKPGVLRSMGSQGVGYNWAIEQQHTHPDFKLVLSEMKICIW